MFKCKPTKHNFIWYHGEAYAKDAPNMPPRTQTQYFFNVVVCTQCGETREVLVQNFDALDPGAVVLQP